HPLRLLFLRRYQTNDVLVQAWRRGIGFDVRDKAIFVFLLNQAFNRLSCCAHVKSKPVKSSNSPVLSMRAIFRAAGAGAVNGDLESRRFESSWQRDSRRGLAGQPDVEHLGADVAIKVTMLAHIRAKPRRAA